MRWKKHSPEEIIGKLNDVRSAVDQGQALSDAIKAAGVSEATYFRWRAQYGSLTLPQLRQLKQLEAENARLRSALAELETASA